MASRLRWLVLVSGLVCASVAWYFWTAGSPPLWSMAVPRAETLVTRAYLTDSVSPGGQAHTVAHIAVAWPPGTGDEVEVPGLWSVHRRSNLHGASELVRDHPVGSRLRVRVVDGMPVADRLDLYNLAYALLTTLLALMLTGSGLAMLLRRLRPRGNGGESAA